MLGRMRWLDWEKRKRRVSRSDSQGSLELKMMDGRVVCDHRLLSVLHPPSRRRYRHRRGMTGHALLAMVLAYERSSKERRTTNLCQWAQRALIVTGTRAPVIIIGQEKDLSFDLRFVRVLLLGPSSLWLQASIIVTITVIVPRRHL